MTHNTIRLWVTHVPDRVALIKALRPLTGQSIAALRTALEQGIPLVECALFGNDFEEVAQRLREIISVLEVQNATFAIYEDGYLIDKTTLLNILEAATQGDDDGF